MATMTVSELLKELAQVPNPSVTNVAITTAGVVTAGETISISHASEISGGIDLADGGAIVITGAA